jgi:hypothetical protein
MSPAHGRPKAGDFPAGDRERPAAASEGLS